MGTFVNLALSALYARETNHKPTLKLNEETNEPWHVLRLIGQRIGTERADFDEDENRWVERANKQNNTDFTRFT